MGSEMPGVFVFFVAKSFWVVSCVFFCDASKVLCVISYVYVLLEEYYMGCFDIDDDCFFGIMCVYRKLNCFFSMANINVYIVYNKTCIGFIYIYLYIHIFRIILACLYEIS